MSLYDPEWKGTFYRRNTWTKGHPAPEAPGGKVQRLTRDSDMFVHYSAFAGLSVESLAEQINVMRAIWHHHVRVNEWDDIAYNFVVFQPYGRLRRARVFTGRGWNRVPASQFNCNTGHWSVCVVTLNEDIKPATVKLLRRLYKESPSTEVKGHKECRGGTATSCPGPKLMAELPNIRG